jgi:hypothetical protein
MPPFRIFPESTLKRGNGVVRRLALPRSALNYSLIRNGVPVRGALL